MSSMEPCTTLITGIFFIVFLSSCAAIQGARGDAASAKDIAAAETSQNTTGQVLNTQTVASPTQPQTPAQKATTNAAKMIAPVL